MTKLTKRCRWFLLCQNRAATTRLHPVLGEVPCCERCAARVDRMTECPTCKEIAGGFGPSHDGSVNCESGSIASGGTHAHCTCDTCF